MSRNNSTTHFQGVSVHQPSLGAQLQWYPAMGTMELDNLINALLPGPASIQDKRAHLSMDFYEYSRLTGVNFKFYPVVNAAPSSTAAPSPASSSAMYDSGYGSSFNASPILSERSPWAQPFTPAHPAPQSQARSRSHSKRKTVAPAAEEHARFASHPGMRIMTKDGLDITNTSRGFKTKEQRDHAHLMRIIKACETCKRKKTRCDPSHKKRAASQAQPSQTGPKVAKKAKVAAVGQPTPDRAPFNADQSIAAAASVKLEYSPEDLPSAAIPDLSDDMWDQFIYFGDESSSSPENYDFFSDPAGYLTPSNESSSSSPLQFFPLPPGTGEALPSRALHDRVLPSEGLRSRTLPDGLLRDLVLNEVLPDGVLPGSARHDGAAASELLPSGVLYGQVPSSQVRLEQVLPTQAPPGQDLPVPSSSEPALPYLNPGGSHGVNYMDFNLYSPSSDYLDEEPQTTRISPMVTSGHAIRSRSQSPVGDADDYFGLQGSSSLIGGQSQRGSPVLLQTESRSSLSSLNPLTQGGSNLRARHMSLHHPLPWSSPSNTHHGHLRSVMIPPYPPSVIAPTSPLSASSLRKHAESKTQSIATTHTGGDALYVRTKTPKSSMVIHQETPPSMTANAASEASPKSSRGILHHTSSERHLAWAHASFRVAESAPSGTPLAWATVTGYHGVRPTITSRCRELATPMSSRAPLSNSQLLHAESDTVRSRLRSTTVESVSDSTSSPLLSGITAASILLPQTMRHTKTSTPIALWLVLACGLISCLLVSDLHSQASDLWSSLSIILSLGSVIFLARSSRQLNPTIQRPCGSTETGEPAPSANIVGPAEPKTRDLSRSIQRFRCAAARQVSKRLGQLGSLRGATLGRR